MRAFAALVMSVCLLSCSGSSGTNAPPSPVPDGTNTQRQPLASVEGVVRAVRPAGSRINFGPPPGLADATVTVISGRAEGLTATTDAMGAYGLRVPEGPLRLRWSRNGYVSIESNDRTAAANARLTMPDVVLATAPWAIAGVVTDSRGNPVPGAVVTVRPGDAFFTTYGTPTTGVDGRYRFQSSQPHFDTVVVSVRVSEGYEPSFETRVPCCDPPVDAIYDVSLVRVLSVTMTGPGTMRVGDFVELPAATVVFDNGTQREIYLQLTSSNPSVVGTERGVRGYAIRALSPGTATITCDDFGVRGTLVVRVTG